MAVIPIQELKRARGDLISSDVRFDRGQFQPSSLDVRSTRRWWRVPGSFNPSKEPIEERLARYEEEYFHVSDRDVFFVEQGKPYVVELCEEIEFPENIWARANPKSTTGRLDLHARLMAEGCAQYDVIPPGYKGKLYLNLQSHSFDVKIPARTALSQIRLFDGDREVLSTKELVEEHTTNPLVYTKECEVHERPLIENDGVFLTVDLSEDIVAYRSKRNARPVDLSKGRGSHDNREFWETIYRPVNGELILEPGYFYILKSKERVSIPPNLACEMVDFNSSLVEARSHYAGFFDPGFGGEYELKDGVWMRRDTLHGSHAVLEVRVTGGPHVVSDGDKFVKLTYERMKETPSELYGKDNNYQGQGLRLAKYFY